MTSSTSSRKLIMSDGGKFLALILVTLFLVPLLVIALPVHASPSWNIQTLDTNGWDLSSPNAFPIAVDSSNNPHIAYTDVLNAGSRSPPEETYPLMYASWTGSHWSLQQIAPDGYADSLIFDSHKNPHILFDSTSYGLKYASWNDSNWDIQTVDSQGSYGSLALDSAGNPCIAYTKPYTEGQELEYASWTGSNWTIQTVATQFTQPISSLIFSSMSLALDSNNVPYIAYSAPGGVYLAVYRDSRWDIQIIALNVTSLGNMVLDYSGNPHLIYAVGSSTLAYASWNGTVWSSQDVTLTLDAGGLGSYGGRLTQASLALDKQGFPHIAYVNSSSTEPLTIGWGYLAYASWSSEGWSIQAVNSNFNVASCSLAIDTKGNPHASLVGVYPNSAAAQGVGAYTWVASVLYAPAESSPVFGSLATFLIILAVGVIVIILASIIFFRRHRKTANLAITQPLTAIER